jgi:hypothetical protein
MIECFFQEKDSLFFYKNRGKKDEYQVLDIYTFLNMND